MTQYTQGEWDLDIGTNGAVISLRDSGTIASIPDDLHNWQEHAFLIAAAPKLLKAAEAAMRYDDAIAKRVINGTVNIIETGGGVAMGDDLDILYTDWMVKSRAAIVAATVKP